MNTTTYREIQSLSRMTVGELREKYLEVFGEETRSRHKEFLRKRIAWRLQALAEGDLSERARRRAEELANDADLRMRAPRDPTRPGSSEIKARTTTSSISPSNDPRLPLPGTLLVREFKGRDILVKVLDDGFEFDGRCYKSLSAIAQEVTGTKWNGFLFFGLSKSGVWSPESGVWRIMNEANGSVHAALFRFPRLDERDIRTLPVPDTQGDMPTIVDTPAHGRSHKPYQGNAGSPLRNALHSLRRYWRPQTRQHGASVNSGRIAPLEGSSEYGDRYPALNHRPVQTPAVFYDHA